MTNTELALAVDTGNITDELLDALTDFYWDFDTYGIMDEIGHIDDDGVRDELKNSIRYTLENSPEIIIEDLKGE